MTVRPRGIFTRAKVQQELHPEADADARQPAEERVTHRAARRREPLRRRAERADAGEHEQVGVERVGVVVVEAGALLEPQVTAIAVVLVVLEEADLIVAETVDDPADDGRFP